MLLKQEGAETQAEEPPVEEKKKGRGRKRKANAAPQYNDVSAGVIYYPPSVVVCIVLLWLYR
jgi:hypothetical protein